MKLKKFDYDFANKERIAGMLLLLCAIFSVLLANSPFSLYYLHLWHVQFFSKPMEFWINDGLMTVFFLLIGLEVKREIYIGELSNIKRSMLPIIAALGGMLVPAFIHFSLNRGTLTSNGFGIPMATDIAFSLAILSLLGTKVPLSLKVFLTALAIIDDMGAILVIALFYSNDFSLLYLSLALTVFAVMLVLNRLKFNWIVIYLIMGMGMWFFMYRSGIHATITGVLLAFAIPFEKEDEKSISYKLQHRLHRPVAFFILPLFALANTAIIIPISVMDDVLSLNGYGIILGLLLGKPIGIIGFSLLGIFFGFCVLPDKLKKRHILFTGFLAGIGFTMSIFITLLAFDDPSTVNSSKIAILLGSLLAGIIGYVGLKLTVTKEGTNF